MKVYVYPADNWGVGSYRMTWPGQAVSPTDADVTVIAPEDRAVNVMIGGDGNAAREEFPRDADVVVFQRVTNKHMGQVVRLLRARGVAVVVDMDDDLAAIHAQNPAFMYAQPRPMARDETTRRTFHVDPRTGKVARYAVPQAGVLRQGRNPHAFHNATQACKDATLVTVSTPELARRYGVPGRVRVLRNCVPARYLTVARQDSAVVGWGGNLVSHPGDLQQVGGAVASLVADGGVFRLVGEPAGVGRALGLREDPPASGDVPIDLWPLAIGEFGVGIAPLADTRFNAAKSWLKPLEYAAVGVPWVGSPRPEYQALHDEGCGLLAARPAAWRSILRRLTSSAAMRKELSQAGRVVAARWTMEANAWRWAEAWAEAARIESGSAAPVSAS